ncbi:hypothetical protein G6F57_020570 [Rhizopus arrhizus]|nr:hypothetical protein G6F57_020570 [Rhizopus arrhizus]
MFDVGGQFRQGPRNQPGAPPDGQQERHRQGRGIADQRPDQAVYGLQRNLGGPLRDDTPAADRFGRITGQHIHALGVDDALRARVALGDGCHHRVAHDVCAHAGGVDVID